MARHTDETVCQRGAAKGKSRPKHSSLPGHDATALETATSDASQPARPPALTSADASTLPCAARGAVKLHRQSKRPARASLHGIRGADGTGDELVYVDGGPC
jgi:hypothetical protein